MAVVMQETLFPTNYCITWFFPEIGKSFPEESAHLIDTVS